MEKEVQRKRCPVLTIISGSLTIINILSFLFLIYCIVTKSSFFSASIFIELFMAIGSFVFVFIAKREKFLGVWIPALIFNIFILGCTPITIIVGGLMYGAHDTRTQRQTEINHLATIDYIKSVIPGTNMFLHDENSDTDPFYYYDYDGKITERFLTLNFAQTYSANYEVNYPYRVYQNSTVEAAFSIDYRYLIVHADKGGFLYGHYEATNYYELTEEEAAEYKQMVDDKIAIQRTACFAKRTEVNNALTVEAVIDTLSKEDNIVLTHVGDHFEKTKRINDTGNSPVLTFLKGLDPSAFTLRTEEGILLQIGLKCESANPETPYSFFYHENERCLDIFAKYDSPFGQECSISKSFLINEEDGNNFLEIINELFLQDVE